MTFRALIVGAGGMGKAWARNVQDCAETEIAGWVDIRCEVAEEAVKELGQDDIFTSNNLTEAIAKVKPDFVIDVTVPESHRDVTVEALNAGLPVLGEKPMAHSMDAAREMVAASERSGKLYMVSQSRRYDSRLAAYKRLIDDEAGAPGILNSDFYIGAHFGGFRDEMPSPLILDMAIHTFDQARYLSGRDAISVYCDEFNPQWSWYRGDSCATAIFEMEGGLRYTYRGSWCSDGAPTSWEGQWRACGPKGTALWDGHDEIVASVTVESDSFLRQTEEKRPQMMEDIPGGIAGSLRDFLNALQTGATPMGECHDNIKSLAMVFAAIESSRSGKKVVVEV
jgi:predicted dehydrogenase